MSAISYNDAIPEVQNYVANGSSANFNNGQGRLITAYLFTREEVYNLVQSSSASKLFVIMALSFDDAANEHYLNPILSQVDNGAINTSNLIQTSEIPYTDTITFNTNPTTNPNGDPVDAEAFQEMQTNYVEAKVANPLLTDGQKIKGYNFTATALGNLGLSTQPTSGNKNDLFAFVPIIRPVDNQNPNACLSFALAQFDAGELIGDIEEFAYPCPADCNNYYQTF